MFGYSLRSLLGRKSPRPPRRRAALRVETLEDRCVPATLFVGSTETYHTIQAAIDASHDGDKVYVRPGTYQEKLTISKDITLKGLQGNCDCSDTVWLDDDHWDAMNHDDFDEHDDGDDNDNGCGHESSCDVTILAPTDMGMLSAANPGAIIHVTGVGTHASIKHFAITGLAGGNENLYYGIRVDGFARADIEQNCIKNIIKLQNGVFATAFGVAIDVGSSVGSPDGFGDQVGSAMIFHNTISNYQRAGVVINHDQSWAMIKNNKIISTFNNVLVDSQTGVEVSDGAVAHIKNNRIAGNRNDSSGTGVLLFAPGAITLSHGDHWQFGTGGGNQHTFFTTVRNNVITGNDYGIFGAGVVTTATGQQTSAVIRNNAITNNTYVGVELDDSSNVSLRNNSISGNGTGMEEADGGIFLFQSTNNTITGNASNNNSGCGIYVDSGSTGNCINNNTFVGNLYNEALNSADVVDLTTGSGTAGTANTWTNNSGQTYITVSGQSLFKKKPKK